MSFKSPPCIRRSWISLKRFSLTASCIGVSPSCYRMTLKVTIKMLIQLFTDSKSMLPHFLLCLLRWRLCRSVWDVQHIRSVLSWLPHEGECCEAKDIKCDRKRHFKPHQLLLKHICSQITASTLSLESSFAPWLSSASSTGKLPPRQAQWTSVAWSLLNATMRVQ